MIYNAIPLLMFFLSVFSSEGTKPTTRQFIAAKTEITAEARATAVYQQLNANNFAMPNLESFTNALEGFYDLKAKGQVSRDILTLIDFSMSSNQKRLWVIDLSTNTILYNTLVAHGRNTGDEYAKSFSNAAESYKSSLGFYVTGSIYNGKHGASLYLNGLEKGVNDNARNRSVVMHGADYVSESFIKQNHRLGRSLGCPAIPVEMTSTIINAIKDKSCLYIYHPCHCKKLAAKMIS
ncbi:murein L,D-transpeptidase catalytic domain family protein [Flavobacterium sp. 3HN19-14]|uniref:murein L,D-transpeptidase catalytic domain family protein n=1 Tax=Flavobacterium sp. 3HN19-14 TaxID=3448133 RepID=UPI003EE2A850